MEKSSKEYLNMLKENLRALKRKYDKGEITLEEYVAYASQAEVRKDVPVRKDNQPA